MPFLPVCMLWWTVHFILMKSNCICPQKVFYVSWVQWSITLFSTISLMQGQNIQWVHVAPEGFCSHTYICYCITIAFKINLSVTCREVIHCGQRGLAASALLNFFNINRGAVKCETYLESLLDSWKLLTGGHGLCLMYSTYIDFMCE